jgi:CubicO group peptidase (beta-lactamase class C family)
MILDGDCDRGFDEVRNVFISNFEAGREVGAAVAVYWQGKLVVDLAAGVRDRATAQPYSRATLQPVFSVTKGVTALAANMLVDRGILDLDAPASSYWPEFAAAGKSCIPVRWLLTHQSGVLGLDRTISPSQLCDWNYVIEELAGQKPDWEPGSKHGYHSLTYGFLVGEIIRRVSGRSVGQFVESEIARPLGADFFIGLPIDQKTRVAAPTLQVEPGKPARPADSGPYAARVFNWISPPLPLLDIDRDDLWAAEIPAANGISNARSVARIFAATIATIDGTRLLSPSTMDRAREEQWRGFDEVMGVENALGLGYLLPTETCPLGGPASFGTAGFGGSRGWAHPELELAFGYTPNLCCLELFDKREVALSRAAVSCAKRLRGDTSIPHRAL